MTTSSMPDVCYLDSTSVSSDTVRCELDQNGTGAQASVWVVTSSSDVQAYGTDAAGNTFCCELTLPTSGVSKHYVKVFGENRTTPDGDLVRLTNGTEQLEPISGISMETTVVTYKGDDDIWGSDSTSVLYEESLQGADGSDDIYGGDGKDFIYGGSGDDFLYGDGGVDIIEGSEGDDYIEGGTEADTLYGDDDNGFLVAGADTIYGGDGNDVICSGGINPGSLTVDKMYGDAGDDYLWAGLAASVYSNYPDVDPVDGGPDSDTCDNNLSSSGGWVQTLANCETTISTDSQCY